MILKSLLRSIHISIQEGSRLWKISETTMNTVLHAFCLDEVDETLNLTRLTVFGNYVVLPRPTLKNTH